jgi:NAD(P)-dependent dehydrogenase (short-subunit alcohol dehydrogenase family)
MGAHDGRVALVTGGALGIGRGIALGFVAEGASVAIADTNRAAADILVAEISATGGRAIATTTDVSSAADAEASVTATLAAYGRLDVLVNNAGIQPVDQYKPLHLMPEDVWDRILDVNLKGAYLMSRFAIPALLESGHGVIVNMASVQGLQSMPGVGPYAASKGGLLSLTRNLAMEYAPQGLRAVAICPGTIDSEMVRTAARASGGDIDASLASFGRTHPLGRIGTPEDVANATVFLASDRASFITGDYLCVDGGYMAQGAWTGSATGSGSDGQ